MDGREEHVPVQVEPGWSREQGTQQGQLHGKMTNVINGR